MNSTIQGGQQRQRAAIQRRRLNLEWMVMVILFLFVSFFLLFNMFLHSQLVDVTTTTTTTTMMMTTNRVRRVITTATREEQQRSLIGQQQQQQQQDPGSKHSSKKQQEKDDEDNNGPAPSYEQIYNFLQKKRQRDPLSKSDLDYDLLNCPAYGPPPNNYPPHFPIMDILGHWNPDLHKVIPKSIYQSLCIFDYAATNTAGNNNKQQQQDSLETTIRLYQKAEIPFIIRNHPDVIRTSYKWHDDEYMRKLLLLSSNKKKNRVEMCLTNHCRYSKEGNQQGRRKQQEYAQQNPGGILPPSADTEMSFDEWLQYAQMMDNENDDDDDTTANNQTHYYYRLNAAPPPQSSDDNDNDRQQQPNQNQMNNNNAFLYDELPFFNKPITQNSSLFMVEPQYHRGINCRFGMRGILADTHYDPSRNYVILLKGMRRYILSNPDQCKFLELYVGRHHPSARHSKLNWSTIAKERHNNYTGPFAQAMGIEVLLQAGDAMYLPTAWFHFIQNLNLNYQCNARSGKSYEHAHEIESCGFKL